MVSSRSVNETLNMLYSMFDMYRLCRERVASAPRHMGLQIPEGAGRDQVRIKRRGHFGVDHTGDWEVSI